MSEKNQSPEQTQNALWYKKWWGIIIAIMILPFFAIWYIWTKTDWSNKVKWIVTIIIIIFSMGAIGSTEQDATQTKQSNQQPTTPIQENNPSPTPQTPQFTFDVPSLIGKNIDEVKLSLENPSKFMEPTKQQLAAIEDWDMEFDKDGNSLLVTYNPKSKIVIDFFIEGNDKNKVLAIGNLKQNSNDYNVQFVNSLKDPNVITGVIASKKMPQELNGNVTYNAVAFKIDNKEDYSWKNCKLEINGGTFSSGYSYKNANIKANDSLIIPFSEFTKDGDRFNFYTQKPESLFISCTMNGQLRSNYFKIN